MDLVNFFSPSSVAVVGASHTPGKVGYSIVESLKTGNFKGKIFPVNPNTESILGLEVFPSIRDIKEKIDLAVIAVPAEAVEKVLKECISKKIPNAIIISAGFSENGEHGKKLEERLRQVILKRKMRVIGPNCLGVYDSYTDLDTLFLSENRMMRPRQGNIAFISQSGAVGSTILDWLAEEGIGISKFISYGNAIDVNELDLLEYLANDKNTKVITAYIEGIKSDGRKFVEVAKKIAKKKPIIFLKAGKTEKGTAAVVSHTGSLAGSAKIYSAVFRQTGIIEASTWEELFDYAIAFSTQPLPKGRRLCIITDGGGFGVLATDEAERQNLILNPPSNKLMKVLKKKFPPYVSLHNPIDLVGDADAERYKTAMEEVLKSNEYDGIVVITLFQVPTLQEIVTEYIIEMKKYNKPILVCSVGSKFSRKQIEKLEKNGVPVYPSPEMAVQSFSAMVRFLENSKK